MDDTNNKERRSFTRIPIESPVKLSDPYNQWVCEIIDISLKGILLKTPKTWEGKEGDSYSIELKLKVSDQDSEERFISMPVVILAHQEGQHAGFHWENIDVDSFIHLRRLIELNLGDQDLIDRELSALGNQ